MLNDLVILSETLQLIQQLHDAERIAPRQAKRQSPNTNKNGVGPQSMREYSSANGFETVFGTSSLLPFVLFVNEDSLQPYCNAKGHFEIEDLQAILKSRRIIAFTDWSKFAEGSDLWDRLRTEVIKPLGRKDFEFIFCIGNIASKWGYQVDEILDIISDFSFNGNVTLALTENEGAELWRQLNGQKDEEILSGGVPNDFRGQNIFNAMNISRLLIYFSDHRVVTSSKQGDVEFKGPKLQSDNKAFSGREYFNAGYVYGLLLKLSSTHCTALGLATSGASLRNEGALELRTVVAYIKDWISELNTPSETTDVAAHPITKPLLPR